MERIERSFLVKTCEYMEGLFNIYIVYKNKFYYLYLLIYFISNNFHD